MSLQIQLTEPGAAAPDQDDLELPHASVTEEPRPHLAGALSKTGHRHCTCESHVHLVKFDQTSCSSGLIMINKRSS